MSAFRVGLGPGRDLVATHVPGRKKPYLGIQQGSTFLALARFISDEDMEALFQALQNVALIPLPSSADLVQGDAKLRENSGDEDATENHTDGSRTNG